MFVMKNRLSDLTARLLSGFGHGEGGMGRDVWSGFMVVAEEMATGFLTKENVIRSV